jgi:N-acetyl-anhydromuramyl-L-alanine amidase AmpD
MPFNIIDDLIPIEPKQAVNRGWTSATNYEPKGITWHWTATWDLETCNRTLGGANAERRNVASAHYAIGRSFAEGVARYVSLDDRSWHAGIHQTLAWNGAPVTSADQKGTRTTIGVETVNIGYARGDIQAKADWLPAAEPNGTHVMRVQPWTDEQIAMMIEIGKEIVQHWPHIGFRDHHGHHDLCPNYKQDVAGFPFARVLRGIYDKDSIPDVWTPFWLPKGRQTALLSLGYDLGPSGADGKWGHYSDIALRRFQRDHSLTENGLWTTFVSWGMYDRLVRDERREVLDLAANA